MSRTLLEVYKDMAVTGSGGIIMQLWSVIETGHQEDYPYLNFTSQQIKRLDDYYYLAHSGDKLASPYLEKISTIEIPNIVHWSLEVAHSFWMIHKDELDRQWALFQKEYDPLASYDVHEETGYEHEGGGSLTKTGSDTRKKTGKITTTDSAWGLNSSTDVDADKSVTEYGEGQTPMQDELVYDSSNETTDTASDTLDVHKYGNLGTTSLTKLLKDDIELWMWDFYERIFFPTVDKHIALPIY